MDTVTIRKSVGWLPRFRQNVWTYSVLVNGRTVASFLDAEDAVKYAASRRSGKRHHNG